MALGRSSFVISLPKHWMQLNGLKKSDIVSLAIQRDRSLVIFPSAAIKRENKDITLHVDSDERESLIIRRIIGCYLNGYTRIKIVSKNILSVSQRKAIRNIVRTLYMRIMESDTKSATIQTLIDESKASLELATKRMHMIANSMCNDVLVSLKNWNTMLAKAVFSLDDDVDHFSFFILRLLRDAAQDPVVANDLGIDPLDCMDYQTLIYRIEHAADYSADMAKHIILLEESKKRIPDDILSLMVNAWSDAVQMYEKAVEAFFSKNVTLSNEILERLPRIIRQDQEIASKAFMDKHKDALIVCTICSIRDDIKRIADCAADIAEIVINRAYKFTA